MHLSGIVAKIVAQILSVCCKRLSWATTKDRHDNIKTKNITENPNNTFKISCNTSPAYNYSLANTKLCEDSQVITVDIIDLKFDRPNASLVFVSLETEHFIRVQPDLQVLL